MRNRVGWAVIAAALMAMPTQATDTAASTDSEHVAQATPLAMAKKRDDYTAAKEALDAGNVVKFGMLSAQLHNYPLWPYLDYRMFRRDLSSRSIDEVNHFLAKYPDLPFINSVKDGYLRQLAAKGDWQGFLALQPDEPRTEVYRCYYYQALAGTGQKSLAWQGAKKIWLNGNSIDERCDPLLKQWRATGGLTGDLILERMVLVYKTGAIGRLKYLQKQLPATHAAQGREIVALFNQPAGVAAFSKRSTVIPHNQALVEAAFARLARADVNKAIAQVEKAAEGQHFDEARTQAMRDVVIRRLFSSSKPHLIAWRDAALMTTQDTALLERRIRLAIREADRSGALKWVQQLPDEERQSKRWTFWHGKLLHDQGDAQGEVLLRSLLEHRHYYSVAAATLLGEPVSFPVAEVQTLDVVLPEHSATFLRIDELKALGLEDSARSEWRHLMSREDKPGRLKLAQEATKRGWHAEAVQATISGKHWEHIRLRFPLAYQQQFAHMAAETGTPMVTLMSIARQESAFNPDVTSSAGARGLMQLMPATAKATAREHKVPYSGVNSLFTPEVNIKLGSEYLTGLLDDMDKNRILAFASYNAGPHRVSRWLARSNGELDVFEFIEAIPFNETRGYVQNVLMFEIYYRQLLDKPVYLLTRNEMERQY
ncbi:murein transglycosylase [Thaumasiovibrio subtropicus]|uniref:murein transglycosylase n=1 Tax=Thaumasiovibrio subtropicus TaxID=1891207 RepID=UPI00131E89DD|nr:murein transglycosylase [Thaumasiovibrio subtropicus]